MSKSKHDEELAVAVSTKAWKRAIQTCEEYELDAAADQTLPSPNYTIYLLSYILDNDLSNARFLWKRIPAQLKATNPDLPAIWKIAQSMLKNQYADVFRAMNAHAFNDADLVRLLADIYRQRNFQLIAKAYTSISIASVADMLGISGGEAQQVCQSAGWSFDAASGTFTPVRPAEAKDQAIGAKQLQHLTEFFCYLEQ